MGQRQTCRALLDAGRARVEVKTDNQRRVPEPSRIAIVGLGSNLGDLAGTVLAAMKELHKLAVAGTFFQSSLWRSSPVDCPPGSPDFVNAVAMFEPSVKDTPESLLAKLQAIERGFGRERDGRANAARTLDLDLIAFSDERRSSPGLTLPHPRAHLRRFVLAPLVEIAPKFQAPGWTATTEELLAGLPPGESVERIIET